jgi:hypothetical protein
MQWLSGSAQLPGTSPDMIERFGTDVRAGNSSDLVLSYASEYVIEAESGTGSWLENPPHLRRYQRRPQGLKPCSRGPGETGLSTGILTP